MEPSDAWRHVPEPSRSSRFICITIVKRIIIVLISIVIFMVIINIFVWETYRGNPHTIINFASITRNSALCNCTKFSTCRSIFYVWNHHSIANCLYFWTSNVSYNNIENMPFWTTNVAAFLNCFQICVFVLSNLDLRLVTFCWVCLELFCVFFCQVITKHIRFVSLFKTKICMRFPKWCSPGACPYPYHVMRTRVPGCVHERCTPVPVYLTLTAVLEYLGTDALEYR
jgi:hypothetical protein